METAESSGLNIAWILADAAAQDPYVDFAGIKNIGSVWGSWRTWRTCGTDNVICHDRKDADNLLTRGFQRQCNFYIPESNFQSLGRPVDCRLYKGDFQHEVPNQNEIVALHLACSQNDILLLLGFDLRERKDIVDRMERHRWTNYKNLIRSLISQDPNKQWILVNHPDTADPDFQDLPNLAYDQIDNIVQQLT
jgi:hypothetical protein